MSLKSDFNSNITGLTKINEVNLVKELVNALNNQKDIKAELYHQKYVCFQNYQSCIIGILKRELCDTMLISKHREYYRVSFIQNKIGINKTALKIKIDCGQHFLLTKKPVIIINGIPSYILNDADFESITTYGILYKDNGWDMDIVSAEKVDCIHCNDISCCRKSSRANYSNMIFCQNTKGYVEYLSLCGLDCLEQNNFEFGEIINRNSFLESEMIAIIKTFTNAEEFKSVLKFLGIENNNEYNHRRIIHRDMYRMNFIVKNLLLIDCTKNEG